MGGTVIITEQELAEIEARAAKATPGPWSTEKPPKDRDGWQLGTLVAAVARGQCVYAAPPGGSFPEADRRFIAHSREDVPSLCALARQHFELVRKLRLCLDDQADDDGLWFDAPTAAEAYLQQELRSLHAMIERHLTESS